MKENEIPGLRQIPLFSELSFDDFEKILRASSLRHLPKGSLIFQEQDEYKGFYVVIEGRVKVYRLQPNGTETIFHVFGAMQTLAEVPMFVGGGYPAHAETLDDSTLLLVQKKGFLDLLHEFPDIAIKMLAGLSKRLKVLGGQIENLTALDVRTRLVRYLIEEYARQKEKSQLPMIELPMSKSLLAAQLGTVLATLSRTFRKLQEEGLIRVSGKKIFLEDVQGLRRLIRN